MDTSQKEIVIPPIKSLSVIIPTYNESQNILLMLDSVSRNLPSGIDTEIIVVDDNSPDGTGKIVEEHARLYQKKKERFIKVIHRRVKRGLSSAILEGIQSAKGETIVVMDGDF